MRQAISVISVIATGLLFLFVFKTGMARLLRMIGNAFIAAGDSVDYCGERFEVLKGEQDAHEQYLRERRA